MHVEMVLDLAERGENGSLLQLPGGVDVRREHEALVFCARCTPGKHGKKSSATEFEYSIGNVVDTTEVRVPQIGYVFRLRVIDWLAKRGQTKQRDSVLDRDALHFPLELRNWRPGDKLHPVGHRSAQKLKRLLNKKRVSRWERSGWPVLTSGGILVWARSFPVAVEFAAGEATRTGILIVEGALS
jgi:tRNA(Ile)-lysidine synthase